MLKKLLLLVALFALCTGVALKGEAQTDAKPFSTKENYTKFETYIPMRDGKRLYTVVFTPKNARKKYPVLLMRTCYSVPYGADNYPRNLGPSRPLAESGCIFVMQDVRGKFMSEGDWMEIRPLQKQYKTKKDVDETTDTYDTVEWLSKTLPNHNGRFGIWGISYPGFYASMGAINAHPLMVASSPQAPVSEWFLGDDPHRNGAFMLLDVFFFYSGTGAVRPEPSRSMRGVPVDTSKYKDSYHFFLDVGGLSNVDKNYLKGRIPYWNELMQHGTYDSYWKDRSVPSKMKNISPALLIVGGWFDAEDMYGALNSYKAAVKQNPGKPIHLVMGPWSHGGWAGGDFASFGDIDFGSKTGQYYRDNIFTPFFTHYFKDSQAKGDAGLNLPNVSIFMTGANEWRKYDQWPPKNVKEKSLYLRGGKRLDWEAPPGGDQAYSEYVSDPVNPVPYSASAMKQMGRDSRYLIEDQRFAAARPDVVTFQTPPLQEDVTSLGQLFADLYITTTGTDADFVVKLIDVFPDDTPDFNGKKMGGYQMLVRGNIMRAKFAQSFEKPVALKPGVVTPVSFELQDIAHRFKKGHRIMVQIQSSWFPLVDRNPQQFLDIYSATNADFIKATHRIMHTVQYPSRLRLSVE
jgi:putative CocE/NonD family hydrolase